MGNAEKRRLFEVETLSLGFALPLFDASFGDVRLPAAAVFLGMLTGGCAAGDGIRVYPP